MGEKFVEENGVYQIDCSKAIYFGRGRTFDRRCKRDGL